MIVSVFETMEQALLHNLIFMFRIALASLCGACIGLERSRRFKEVGIRTHVIVCCAAALIMIISKYGFADLINAAGQNIGGSRGADPARIAAQAISGISFLGAGVIFKNGSGVKGLTTAAGIWATAAIGLAIGSGLLFMGIFVTILISVFQIVTHKYTVGMDSYVITRVRLTVEGDQNFRPVLDEKIKAWKAHPTSFSVSEGKDGQQHYDMYLMAPQTITTEELMEFSNIHPEIKFISGEMQIG